MSDKPSDIPVATVDAMRADLVEAMKPFVGSRLARDAVHGPAPGDPDVAAYAEAIAPRPMVVTAVLFDPATGERATITEEYKAGTEEGCWYIWHEGNNACDCNRRLSMARAAGRPEPEQDECGHTIVLEQFKVADAPAAGETNRGEPHER